MIVDVVVGVSHTNLNSISRKHTHLINKIIANVNRLIEAINEVRGVVEAETQEQSRLILDEAISNVVTKFLEEEGQE